MPVVKVAQAITTSAHEADVGQGIHPRTVSKPPCQMKMPRCVQRCVKLNELCATNYIIRIPSRVLHREQECEDTRWPGRFVLPGDIARRVL